MCPQSCIYKKADYRLGSGIVELHDPVFAEVDLSRAKCTAGAAPILALPPEVIRRMSKQTARKFYVFYLLSPDFVQRLFELVKTVEFPQSDTRDILQHIQADWQMESSLPDDGWGTMLQISRPPEKLIAFFNNGTENGLATFLELGSVRETFLMNVTYLLQATSLDEMRQIFLRDEGMRIEQGVEMLRRSNVVREEAQLLENFMKFLATDGLVTIWLSLSHQLMAAGAGKIATSAMSTLVSLVLITALNILDLAIRRNALSIEPSKGDWTKRLQSQQPSNFRFRPLYRLPGSLHEARRILRVPDENPPPPPAELGLQLRQPQMPPLSNSIYWIKQSIYQILLLISRSLWP